MIRIALLLAFVSSAIAVDCRNELVDSTNCFLDESDNVVIKNDINVLSMAKCIDRVSDSCSTVVTEQFTNAIKNINPQEIKKCAIDAIGPVKEGMKKCMIDKGYKSDYQSPDKIIDRAGAQVIGLIFVIKFGEKKCKPLLNCLPKNFDAYKADLCAAKTQCFPPSTLNECPNMEGQLEIDSCDCYKAQSNKQEQLVKFEDCLSEKDRAFITKIGDRLASNVLLKEVEKQVCEGTAHYTDKYDICKDDDFGKVSKGKHSGYSGTGLGGLINRG